MSLRGHAKGGCKPTKQSCMPGAGFSERNEGKAPSDIPALKPYWGKPTVRKCVQRMLACSVGEQSSPTEVKVRAS